MLRPNRNLLFIIILTLLILTSFIGKAFHSDDVIMLYAAKKILKTPLLSYFNGTINWYGMPQSFQLLSDSVFIPYFIAFIINLIGESELGLHIFFLIFPIITIISMYFLSKRFTSNPLISTLLLISAPAFIVSSTNIVADISLLAFYLMGMCTFIYGLDRENKLWLIISGFIVGLACLTKYTGFIIIPLLFVYSILKRRLSKGLLALSIFFILPGIWCLHNLIFFKKIQFIEGLYWFKPTLSSIISNLLGSLTYLSSVTVFPLLFLFLLKKKKDWFIYFLIIWLITILSIEWLLKSKYPLFQIILLIFFISVSIFICQKFIESLRRKKFSNYTDTLFLLIWFGVIFCYNIFIQTWFTAPRYILILTPPIILLFIKKSEMLLSQNRGNIFRSFIYIGIVLNSLFSTLISIADYVYADTYRNFAQTYTKYMKEKGTKIWFRGHWGQYYMEKQGFEYLGLDDVPKKDEIIVMPTVCGHEPFSSELKERLKFIGSIEYEAPYPIRTVSPPDRISFYSYSIGSLPYGISNEPLEVFQIWQVE